MNVPGGRAGDAPVYFAQLRPAQTAIATARLIVVVAYLLVQMAKA